MPLTTAPIRRPVLDATALPPAARPVLDAAQQAVVDHRSGPLLVLAGPGTGKTTTIVEAIAARIERDQADPQRILALTFGRRAAADLRDRLVARLGGGLLPTVSTFHSFAYGLLQRTATADEYLDPPRLLSGAEEDVRIRELLIGAIEDGAIDWPDDLRGAVGTLGLANEIRAVLARAKALGLEPAQLARIGLRSDRPAWAGLGQLAAQESAVMVLQNVLDYAELLHRAVIRANSPEVAASVARSYRAIYVDEYQDTDRLQVSLLSALVGAETDLVAVGDPDQSIYAFRGADATGILDFPNRFPAAAGQPAPVIVLGTTRRFGTRISAAASSLIGRQPIGRLPAEVVHAHRHPVCQSTSEGDVQVQLFDSESARAAHVAEQIRFAHLHQRLPWSAMAVLVRNGHAIPSVQRALMQQGVPVAVAADELPLRAEPAVAHLLAMLELACDANGLSDEVAQDLLLGPMSDLDASDVRRLGRALRQEARQLDPTVVPVASSRLVAEVLRGERPCPDRADLVEVGAVVERLRRLLACAHDQIAGGATPQEVLWTLWSGQVPGSSGAGSRLHGWPERLRQAALAGSATAGHDLDAVIALFEAVDRLQGRYQGVLGVRNVLIALRDQQIPGEPIAERAVSGDTVRILTAHRAKGLEWEAVWIVGAEEGQWPDLRPRGSVLEPDRLSADGIGPGVSPADLLAEERRLFYVAITRARRQLVIAALASEADAGPQPSRFLDDLRLEPDHIRPVRGWPRLRASTAGLVARLRTCAVDPSTSPALRQAAIEHLAQLANAHDDGGLPLVPAADPDQWWGVREPTPGVRPVRPAGEPIALSGSGLEQITTCPLRWFLEHEARAEVLRPPATKFGSVVHALADYVAKGEVAADLDTVDAWVDRVWRDLRFEAGWQSEAERAQARQALARFLRYHQRAERSLVDTEREVRAVLDVPTPSGHPEAVRLRGFLDRIERDDQGRLVPIDLKNMKQPPPDREIPGHAQLGVYQLLLRQEGHQVGGAALVQLRVADGKDSPDPKVQIQPPLESKPQGSDNSGSDQPTWVEVQLGQAAEILRQEAFVARPNPACRHCHHRLVCPTQAQGRSLIAGDRAAAPQDEGPR